MANKNTNMDRNKTLEALGHHLWCAFRDDEYLLKKTRISCNNLIHSFLPSSNINPGEAIKEMREQIEVYGRCIARNVATAMLLIDQITQSQKTFQK